MSKVIYENVHTGRRGEIDADKYEAFARRVNAGVGIVRKVKEVKSKETPKPAEAKQTKTSKTKDGDK
jgi:hypothetical protein